MQVIYIKRKLQCTERKRYHTAQSLAINLNMLQQSACVLFIPITVVNFASHFNKVRHNDDLDIRLHILFDWAAAFSSAA